MSDVQTLTAYCFHCRQKRVVENPEKVIMKTNMNAVKGKCAACGGKLFRILPKQKTAK